MTEQEKRRRRRQMERRMRTGGKIRGRETEQGGLFSFRLYVTAVLVSGCFLISFFDTASANAICGRIKAMAAEQISAETLAKWREKAQVFWQEQEISLPAFLEKEEEEAEGQKIYLPDTEDSP